MTQPPQWLSRQVAVGRRASSGQSGARQRTAAHALDQAAARSSAFLRVVTRGQSSAAQQALLSFTGSGLYVVIAQSSSLAHSMAVAAGGFLSGAVVGSAAGGGVASAGVGVAAGSGWWSCAEQAARASTRTSARMGKLLCP